MKNVISRNISMTTKTKYLPPNMSAQFFLMLQIYFFLKSSSYFFFENQKIKENLKSKKLKRFGQTFLEPRFLILQSIQTAPRFTLRNFKL